jgi:hypothetical protein
LGAFINGYIGIGVFGDNGGFFPDRLVVDASDNLCPNENVKPRSGISQCTYIGSSKRSILSPQFFVPEMTSIQMSGR